MGPDPWQSAGVPTKISKADFTRSLSGKTLDVDQATADSGLAGLDVARADLNHDGKIQGATEAGALFKEIDVYDRDGNSQTVALVEADGVKTRAGTLVNAARALAVFDAVEQPPAASDAALRKAFATPGSLPAVRGSTGDPVIAIQYGLARLGLLRGPVDGQFGGGTEAAIKTLQTRAGLPPGGAFDGATLTALDRELSRADFRTPAERSGDRLAYLTNFSALAMAPMAPLTGVARAADWNHPELQARYGEFVGQFWEHCKTNRVEADCKTLSLFLMDQFRAKVKNDLGVQLPRPGTSAGQIPAGSWQVATAPSGGGFFQRFEKLPQVRAGYERAQAIQRLDPKASMLMGTNLRYAGTNADAASRGVKVTIPWQAARDNAGDQSRPELPIAQLKPGDVVFIDHTGDGKVDHMFNVVRLDRDAQGIVKRAVLATGSFDDMKDALGTTAPQGLDEVNQYTEEVTVDFDAAGRITSSAVTWSSEPAWLVDSRYSARTLLMELKPGGRISVGRWGQG